MKKNIKITTIILTALVSILFTSCFDPIYSVIRNDVKPEKATVNGFVNSVARYKIGDVEYLFLAANDGLRYKRADNQKHGSWGTLGGLPFASVHNSFESENYEGKQIVKVVADTDYLYLVTVSFDKREIVNPQIWAGKINADWKIDEKGWKEITPLLPEGIRPNIGYYTSSAGVETPVSNFNVFFTNDVDLDKRHAYMRIMKVVEKEVTPVYFELDGYKAPTDITTTVNSNIGDPQKENVINGAVWNSHKNGIEFFNSPSVTRNTFTYKDSSNTEHTDEYIYYGNGNNLKYYQVAATKDVKSISAENYIASLAVCNDAILIGCGKDWESGGIKKMSLNNGKPVKLEKFTNNAEAQMPSIYTVNVLLNVDPTQSEKDSTVYSSITFPGSGTSGNARYENVGLWSYYPGRGNWNRE